MLFPAVKLLIISHAFAAEALKTEESSNVPKKQQNSTWLTEIIHYCSMPRWCIPL
jgi:hypothetical protein